MAVARVDVMTARRSRRRKPPAWAVIAVLLVLGLILHSFIWAAFITAVVYTAWRIPARGREQMWSPKRSGPPVGYGRGMQNAGRGREEDVHEYAERMTKKLKG